ncbi:MAG: hypothetical protein ABIH69_04900 [bacterium]
MVADPSIARTLFPEVGTNFANISRNEVTDFYSGFKSSLADVMGMLTDEGSDLEVGGYRIAADQKNGSAGTYLLNEWLSEQEFIFSQLLESYKFQQNLENKINNFSFS